MMTKPRMNGQYLMWLPWPRNSSAGLLAARHIEKPRGTVYPLVKAVFRPPMCYNIRERDGPPGAEGTSPHSGRDHDIRKLVVKELALCLQLVSRNSLDG